MAQEKNKTDKDDAILMDEDSTPIEESERQTGQGGRSTQASDGAQPETPGREETEIVGAPNQGTEAR